MFFKTVISTIGSAVRFVFQCPYGVEREEVSELEEHLEVKNFE
jgi:hypothetical protein